MDTLLLAPGFPPSPLQTTALTLAKRPRTGLAEVGRKDLFHLAARSAVPPVGRSDDLHDASGTC